MGRRKKIPQNVGQLVIKNYNFLKNITRTKSNKKLKNILNKATPSELLTLIDIASNILNSNFKLTHRQKLKLIPHANFIRNLARKKSETSMRKSLNQIGNGPAVLLPLITPILAEAASHLINKFISKNGK